MVYGTVRKVLYITRARATLLYPPSRSLLHNNRTGHRTTIAVGFTVGKTTTLGMGWTREHVGSGYSQNAGEKCDTEER